MFKITSKNDPAKERRQNSLIQNHLELEAAQQSWLYQRKICQIIAIIAAGISICYSLTLWLVFFSGWGALFDLGFFLLHLVAFYWIKLERYSVSAYWTLVLVSAQIAFGVALFVGPETGFQYYLLCLPAVVYMVLLREPGWRKLSVVTLGFLMLYVSEHISFPTLRVEISNSTQQIMYYGNLVAILVINYFSIKFFVDEAKASYREQKKLVLSDSLTGLSNRRYIVEFAHKLLALCQRYEHPISVIMLDVDHFKQVNDAYGHHVGDDALQLVANCLRTKLRDSDVAARYGGEEFLILMPETELLKAEEIAERIRIELAGKSLLVEGKPVHITASLGVSCSDNLQHCTADLLIKRADAALYDAKKAGRNCVKLAF